MNTAQVNKSVEEFRKATFPIEPLFINRWSPRSFLEKSISEELLFSLFEAARWAPSANNSQPWSFIIARSDEDKAKFHSFILEGNLAWCSKAPVLAMALSKKMDNEKVYKTHAFDAGMACANLALQATAHGLITHFMGGIDMDKARRVLEIPAEYEIHGVIAIGYQGEKEALSETLQLREQPNGRKELSEIVFEGSLQQNIDFSK